MSLLRETRVIELSKELTAKIEFDLFFKKSRIDKIQKSLGGIKEYRELLSYEPDSVSVRNVLFLRSTYLPNAEHIKASEYKKLVEFTNDNNGSFAVNINELFDWGILFKPMIENE